MWTLNFISEIDFENHVKATIKKYGEKLESFDLKRFNKNLIDPIKLIFDKTVYRNPIIMTLATFIKEYSSISETVKYLKMAKVEVGM